MNLLIYCPFCRAVPSWVCLDELASPDELFESLRRDTLRCHGCRGWIGSIGFRGETFEDKTLCDLKSLFSEPLYHYTSIDAVLKILRHRTLRFTRLDLVNDPFEAYSEDFGDTASKYVFASCWTYDPGESLIHWGRYTGDTGCRIGLPVNMFPERQYPMGHLVDYEKPGVVLESYTDLWNAIQWDFCSDLRFGVELTIRGLPEFQHLETGAHITTMQTYVCGPTYVSYLPALRPQHPRIVTGNKFDMRKVGISKLADWAHEREVRFRIFATTSSDADSLNTGDYGATPFSELFEIKSEFVDVPLDVDALTNADILLGPCTPERDVARLRAYIDKHFPGITLRKSGIGVRPPRASSPRTRRRGRA